MISKLKKMRKFDKSINKESNTIKTPRSEWQTNNEIYSIYSHFYSGMDRLLSKIPGLKKLKKPAGNIKIEI